MSSNNWGSRGGGYNGGGGGGGGPHRGGPSYDARGGHGGGGNGNYSGGRGQEYRGRGGGGGGYPGGGGGGGYPPRRGPPGGPPGRGGGGPGGFRQGAQGATTTVNNSPPEPRPHVQISAAGNSDDLVEPVHRRGYGTCVGGLFSLRRLYTVELIVTGDLQSRSSGRPDDELFQSHPLRHQAVLVQVRGESGSDRAATVPERFLMRFSATGRCNPRPFARDQATRPAARWRPSQTLSSPALGQDRDR